MSSHSLKFARQTILQNTRGQNKDLDMDVMTRQISIYKYLKCLKVKWVALGISEFFITGSVQANPRKLLEVLDDILHWKERLFFYPRTV